MSKKNKNNPKREPNRSYGKIRSLNVDVRNIVDMMLQSNCKYQEIVEFIKDNADVDVDRSMVCRYARRLNSELKDLRFAQQNLKLFTDEINRYPGIDSTEAIARLLSSKILLAIQELKENAWEDIDPLELIDKSAKLMRVVSYKKDVDIKTQNIKNIAFDSFKEDIFNIMAEENPQLYNSLVEYLNGKEREECL